MKERKVKRRNYSIKFEALDKHGRELYNNIYQEYDRVPILELREYAKQMGIRAVTTMDKKSLVEAMTRHRISNTIYIPVKETQVRPVTIEEVDKLTEDYLMRTFVLSPEKRKGILDVKKDGAWLRVEGFITNDSDVFVPMRIVNDYMLMTGDEICGLVRFMEKSGRYGLFKIDKINGQNADEFRRRQLDNPGPSSDIIKMERGSMIFNALSTLCPFIKGERKLIVGLSAVKLDALAREISLNLFKQGFETINLFLDESPESISKSISLPGSSLVLSCESHEKYDDAIRLAVSYAKRIAPYGRDVAIILNNADILKEENLRAAFGAGRFTASGSITTVVISSGLELSPAINRLSRTANSIAIFKNNFGEQPLVDLSLTYSENQKQLSLDQQKAINDARTHLNHQFVTVQEFMTAYDILLANS